MRPTLLRLSAVLAIAFQPAHAQILTSGLLVDLDFTTLSEGPLTNLVNSGSMGGVFETRGRAAAEIPRMARPGGGTGTPALFFDGVDHMQHVTVAGVTNLISAAPGLTGANPTRTIEAWVFNPTLQDEETLLSWGRRGVSAANNGNNMSFNYGTAAAHGAAGHWGPADIGWNNAGGAPAAGVWHHLAYTFDGTTTRVYVDGALANSEVATVNTLPLPPISLAAQNTTDEGALDGALRGALALGRVRVHDGALSAADIAQNFAAEAPQFTIGPAVPLSVRPKHRYSFHNPASPTATGSVIEDREADADGVVLGAGALFNGTHLVLPGGASTSAAYVDLPNGLISTNAAANGGTGRVTVEGWYTPRISRNWGRVFDFGIGTAGEITAPGGTATGLDHFVLTSQIGNDVTRKLLEIKNDNGGGGPTGLNGTTVETSGLGVPLHFAVTWDEATGQVKYYENGFLVSDFVTNKQLQHIQDVNVWLGRSSWTADLNTQADYDEFRIYAEVLSPGEIRNNFNYGPDVVFTAPGALQSVSLEIAKTDPFVNTWQKPRLLAGYLNVQDVDVSASTGTVFRSANSNIVVVTAARELRAVGLGTVDILGVHGGFTSIVSVTVVPESAVLEHRYSFVSDTIDSVGGAHGTLQGGATLSDGRVVLNAATLDHVRLPPGLITGDYAVSVEAWADVGVSGVWARLFDFGDTNLVNQGRYYITYSPRSATAGQKLTISNTDPGFTVESAINLAGTLENRGPTHVVCVVHPSGRRLELYLNGSLAGVTTNVTQTLAGVTDAVNFLGRSLFAADAYLNGAIDEFRIYDGVLTPRRVALNFAAGPDTVGPEEEGSLVAVALSSPSSLALHLTGDATLFGDYANVNGVNLELTQAPAYFSSNPSVATVGPGGIITPRRPGQTVISGAFGGFTNGVSLTVTRTLPLDLAHRYPFDGNCNDVIGAAHGTLVNNNGNAAFASGQLRLGNAGTEPSSGALGNFVDLPNGVWSALGANATLEIWTTWNPASGTSWQRTFDFGRSNGGEGISDNGANHEYVFHTPRSGAIQILGVNRFTTAREERRVNGAATMAANAPVHLVVVWDGATGFLRLYENAVLVGQVALHVAMSEFEDVNNWLGRSQFGGDAYYNGIYDEVRLYRGAMASGEVEDSFAAGPAGTVVQAPAMSVAVSGLGEGRISWSTALTGYVLQYSDGLPGGWADLTLPVTEEGGEFVVRDNTTATHRVYRLRKGP